MKFEYSLPPPKFWTLKNQSKQFKANQKLTKKSKKLKKIKTKKDDYFNIFEIARFKIGDENSDDINKEYILDIRFIDQNDPRMILLTTY